MTIAENTIAGIERDEAWLQGAMPAAPPVLLERPKFRIRIEVNQVWLERSATADPNPSNFAAMKRAIRLEAAGMARLKRMEQ